MNLYVYLVLGNVLSYLLCLCTFICFTVGEWETFLSIALYVLTCEEIDNKATLTFDFDNVLGTVWDAS